MSLKLEKVSFKYFKKKSFVFNDISFEVNKGSITGVIGKNGSGKTTFLNCLAGYNNFNSGKATINNISLNSSKKKISLVSQSYDLIPYLSIFDNIIFFLKFFKKKIIFDKITIALKKYNIEKTKNKLIAEVSKGMFRKTQIVISLLLKAELLLLDEPFDGLDEDSSMALNQDLQHYKSNGVIIIIASHDFQWVKKNSTQIFSMDTKKFILDKDF